MQGNMIFDKKQPKFSLKAEFRLIRKAKNHQKSPSAISGDYQATSNEFRRLLRNRQKLHFVRFLGIPAKFVRLSLIILRLIPQPQKPSVFGAIIRRGKQVGISPFFWCIFLPCSSVFSGFCVLAVCQNTEGHLAEQFGTILGSRVRRV